MYDILDKFNDFKDIKRMSIEELNEFSSEIRQFLVEKVSKTGGHLASNLGVVELTLSLYNVFDFDKDKLIWDVGHQSYVHKILTGRKDKFDTLRKYGGLSGFPKYEESKYDMFETGHSSTSISAAVGMARARDIKHENYEVVSVIGDGALTGGMALEALNDLGFNKTKVIIVLNDNQMSISKNVGGISTYLSTLRTNPGYTKFKKDFNSTVNKIPNIGKHVTKSLEKFKNGIKQMIVPGMLFEDMGIEYLGPIDGHNIKDLSRVFSMAKNLNKPVIIHVITKKGKGYDFAEKNPGKFHGIGPFNSENGELKKNSGITYSKAFGNEILKLAKENKKIVAITAAMRDATGLGRFSTEFKERFFDVGIAEEHAVTMAAGMAKSGLIPVFAVYSTFLQRGYDQILHDVCMQDLHVILAIDRAGIVGEDGETHQGVFDLSYLSEMPNMTILTPKCTGELKYILKWAVNYNHPVAIRYPKGEDYDSIQISPLTEIKKGIWEVISGGDDIAIIACGKMLQKAVMAKSELMKNGINVMVINACFVKPIDKGLINELIQNDYKIVTIEDNIVHGGFGSMVLEYVNSLKPGSFVMNLGYKDSFIPHGNTELLYKINGLDVRGICESILKISK